MASTRNIAVTRRTDPGDPRKVGPASQIPYCAGRAVGFARARGERKLWGMPLTRTCSWLAPIVVSTLASAQEEAGDELRAALQERLDAFVAQGSVPGVSAGIVLEDGKRLELVAGVSDRESGRELRVGDRMLAGSVGKTFVAAVALQLAQEQALELDGLAGEVLGGASWWEQVPNAESLTLRHLLSHRTGLARYVFEADFVAALKDEPDRVWQPQEQVGYVLGRAPLFAAGEGFAYADTNYLLVGMMIERVAEGTLYDEVQRRLLGPLELDGVVPSDSRDIEGLVQGHVPAW